MKLGGGKGLLVRVARFVARVVVAPSFWPIVDDDLQEELATRVDREGPRWRTAAWGALQYLCIAVRLGAERLTSIRNPVQVGNEMARGEWSLDLKQAVRALRLRPGIASAVIVTVALAVGATTSVYSVVAGVLLQPLPYPEPDRLARIWQTDADWRDSPNEAYRSMADRLWPVAPIYYEWMDAATGFESLGAYVDATYVLQQPEGVQVVRGQETTSGIFSTLGIEPILGRRLVLDDDAPGAPLVVVVGEGFWREHLGSRRDALGAQVILNGRPHTVVGVMPTGFLAPAENVLDPLLPSGAPLLWTPLTDESRRGWKSVLVIGRLAPGVALETAAERLAAAQSALVAAHRDPGGDRGVRVTSLLDSVVGGVRSTLWFLVAAVALVLVVAAVNIANILTALGLSRRRELAVRAALGAGVGRLVRGLFVESALLVTLGGLGGILVAWISLPLLLRFLPPTLPRQEQIGMSTEVLLWGLAVTGVTALLVGTLPATFAARVHPQDAMRASARGFTSGRAAVRVRGVLVVVEVSLALVLLIVAGLLGSSYTRLQGVDRGFATEGIAALRILPDRASYNTEDQRDRWARAVRDRLATVPGVSASAVNNLPLSGLNSGTTVHLERGAARPQEVVALLTVGLDNYLAVMGIPVLAGRGFEPSDARDTPPVAIVNETMARRYWSGGEVIGQRLRTSDDSTAFLEVIGVAADVRHRGLASSVEPTVYVPASQSSRETNELVLRIRGDVAVALRASREAIASLSPTTPVTRVLLLDETIADSVAIPRFRAFFVVGLAALAAVLALLGIYGVLSFSVAARTEEIGVRMALGAHSGNVVSDVVGSGLRLAATGVAIGLPIAWIAANVVKGFLFEIVPGHPLTWLVVVGGVLALSCAAAYLPARRAAGVDAVRLLNGD